MFTMHTKDKDGQLQTQNCEPDTKVTLADNVNCKVLTHARLSAYNRRSLGLSKGVHVVHELKALSQLARVHAKAANSCAVDKSLGNKKLNQMKEGIKELVQLLFQYKAKYDDIMHLNQDSVQLNVKYAKLNEAFKKYKESATIKRIQREQQHIDLEEESMTTIHGLTEKLKNAKIQDEMKRIDLANQIEVIEGNNAEIQTLKSELIQSEKIRCQNEETVSLKSKQITALEAESKMKSMELSKIKPQKDSLIKDQNESSQKVEELTKNMDEIKRSLADSQQKYENARKSKEMEQSQARELGEQLEAMQIENSIQEIEIVNKNEMIKTINTHNETLKIDLLRAEEAHQQNEAAMLIAFDKIKNENEALVHKQSDNIKEKDLNIQQLNEEIANNERISLSQNDTIKRLQHEIDTNKSEAINLTQKVAELEGLIKEKEISITLVGSFLSLEFRWQSFFGTQTVISSMKMPEKVNLQHETLVNLHTSPL